MDVSEFYENIVLRDLLEYTVPGAVTIGGFGIVHEALSARLGLGTSIAALVHENFWPVLFLSLILSYVTGHILTSIHSWLFRGADRDLALKVLGEQPWLKSIVVKIISNEMELSNQEVLTLIDNKKTAEIMREIGRGIIQENLPKLHREYVGRHSILSRFCQNMVIAIYGVVISLSISIWLVFDRLCIIVQGNVVAIVVVGVFVCAIVVLSILALHRRSARLRLSMARHTFEIWFVASKQLAKKEAAPSPVDPL